MGEERGAEQLTTETVIDYEDNVVVEYVIPMVHLYYLWYSSIQV